MLVSPKWQTMWTESQYCSKNLKHSPKTSVQTEKKMLKYLTSNYDSTNKQFELEALKYWGVWIKNQNPDNWKLYPVCFTAIRPFIIKKSQPLHKDVDMCKLKLSLMWSLIFRVQGIMQLEGPQYILEVFLQFCENILSNSEKEDDEIISLVFQLLLALFKNDEGVNTCDKEMFPSLSVEVFGITKLFHSSTDILLNIFTNWRKVKDKSTLLKIWKSFLGHCNQSCENIPTTIWHKIFNIVGDICSEKSEPVKERLGFLHGCAITLKSVLNSPKFIDHRNFLTTPCEALIRKLVELCSTKCENGSRWDMFILSKETCEVLAEESISINKYHLCIYVVDMLENFYFKCLLWGVWCGLVHSFQMQLSGIGERRMTRIQKKFYRKLRGVVANLELDVQKLHKDCLPEMASPLLDTCEQEILHRSCSQMLFFDEGEGCLPLFLKKANIKKCIKFLNINWFCSKCGIENDQTAIEGRKTYLTNYMDNGKLVKVDSSKALIPAQYSGSFSALQIPNQRKVSRVVNIKYQLVKNILRTVNITDFAGRKPVLPIEMGTIDKNTAVICEEVKDAVDISETPLEDDTTQKEKLNQETEKENEGEDEDEDEIISTPKTRSKRKAEEEEKKELEGRRKRKSFEMRIQEIVKKNKLRKTEKNTRKKSPVVGSRKTKRNKSRMEEIKKEQEGCKRELRNSKSEEPVKKSTGKLENYFKVITKKSVEGVTKNGKASAKEKKINKKKDKRCCIDRKNDSEKKEFSWKQTSLKMMMNGKRKTEKFKQKHRKGGEEKSKGKNEKIEGKDLTKLSTFKEVFHDHEYAKMEPLLQSLIKSVNKKPEVRVVPKSKSKGNQEKQAGGKIFSEPKDSEVSKVQTTQKLKKEKKDKISPKPKVSKTSEKAKKLEVKTENLDQEEKETLQPKEILSKETEATSSTKPETRLSRKLKDVESSEVKFLSKSKRKAKAEMKKCQGVVKVVEKEEEKMEPSLEPEEMLEKCDQDETTAALKPKVPAVIVEKIFSIIADDVATEINRPELPSDLLGQEKEMQETDTKENETITQMENKILEEQSSPVVLHPEKSNKSEKFSLNEANPSEQMEVSDTKETKPVFEIEDSVQTTENDINADLEVLEGSTEIKTAKKRPRTSDTLMPNKKFKLDEENTGQEKLCLQEVVERKNMEELEETSPKPTPLRTINGTISSRALRMIALVPELSQPGQQVHREVHLKAEVIKSKKGPNVDKNSRASKMLALLSENVAEEKEEVKESRDVQSKEVNSIGAKQPATTPTTPTTTLKSPNSAKKRKLIRFDDAKNETVLYLTNTPPSQIRTLRKTNVEEAAIF